VRLRGGGAGCTQGTARRVAGRIDLPHGLLYALLQCTAGTTWLRGWRRRRLSALLLARTQAGRGTTPTQALDHLPVSVPSGKHCPGHFV